MRKINLSLLILLLLLTACTTSSAETPEPTPTNPPATLSHPIFTVENLQPGQTPFSFISDSEGEIRYLFYLPLDYDPDKEWPLIVFLHGWNANGYSIKRLYDETLPNYGLTIQDFPFMVVAPQLPSGLWPKYFDPIEQLIDHLIEVLPVDPDRIYLTGLSQGGHGTWRYAIKYPDRFAAIAPIASGALLTSNDIESEAICRIKDLPVWAFHGEDDGEVPTKTTIETVEALEACGGNVKLTLFPEIGHWGAWQKAYGETSLMKWLLEHSK